MSGTVWPRSRILLLFLALVSVATVSLGGFGRSAGKRLVSGSEVAGAPFSSISASDHAGLGAVYSHLPLAFEPNQGQSDPRVKFLARGGAYGLFLTADEAVLVLQNSSKRTPRSAKQTAVVRMALDGANSSAAAGTDPLPGNSNYFIGNDPAKWHRKIPQFARVHYQNVYPGIDLVYYGNQGRLEYDFEVSPGADPSAIALQFPGVEKVALNAQGDLVLVSGGSQVRFEGPRIYQNIGQEEKAVPGRFIQRGKNRVGFALGDYDRGQTLIIDPVLAYSTYLGGTGEEACSVISVIAPAVISPIKIDGIASPPSGCPAVTADSSGNIYIAGATTSTDFPNPTKSPTLNGSSDAFIAKINPTAPSGTSQLFYSTYLGGSGGETTAGVGVDSGFNVIVAGNTNSGDFPTNGVLAPFQTKPVVAGTHGFVSKLDAAGSTLIYSTYLSGNGTDTVTGLALDVKGKAYVTGTTTSTNTPITAPFPATLGAFQTSSLAAVQFFMSKVDPAISGFASLPYSTYFGGAATADSVPIVANGGGIAVDTSANTSNIFDVYFTGGTNFLNTGNSSHVTGGPGTDFPILNAYQVCLDTPVNSTTSPCQTTGATFHSTDIFLAKINPAASPGAQLLYSTYLGGTSSDVGYGVAVDSGFNAYLTGWTTSPDFNFTLPTSVTSVFQKCLDTPVNPPSGSPCPTISSPLADAFVAKIGPPCSTTTTTCPQGTVPLLYFTYLGGSGTDVGLSVAVDSIQGAQVTGWTNSSGGASTAFPHPNNPIQSDLAGGTDAFVARIDTTATSATALGHFGTYLGGTGNDAGTSIALDAQNQTYVGGETFSNNFPTANPFQPALNGPSDAFIAKLGPKLGLKATETASPNPVGAGNQVSFVYTLTNNGDLTSGITFNDTFSSTGVTFVSANSSPGTCTTALAGSVTCFVGTLNGGASATVTVILIPTSSGSLSDGGQFTVSGVSIKPNPPAVAMVNDFTITVAPTVATVPAGTPATYTVTAAPSGVPYPDTVTLSVSSTLPPGVTQSFQNNASSIPNLDSGAQSRVLVLSTSLRVTTPASLWRKGGPLYAAWLPVLGLALTGVGIGRKKTWRRRWLMGVLLGGFLTLTLFQTNCGSSAPTPTTTGTPAGTYTLTVSASSGSVSHTQQISLVVQ
jgi:hypothetical protein